MASDTILTIGHSNHEEGPFIDLLNGQDVKLLADVRVNPRSRYPHFNRPALAASLEAAGIGYAHLGEALGGRRDPGPDSPNVGWDQNWFRGYADHMASELFASGLAELEGLATQQRTAVMCAEADWRSCHRRMVADALLQRRWRILHIGPAGLLEEHELTDFAVVEGGRITYPEPQTSLDV